MELRALNPPGPLWPAKNHFPYRRLGTLILPARKILYVHNDPVHSVLSLNRRNDVEAHLIRTRTDPLPELHPRTLAEIAAAPTEMFQYEQQFDSYFHQCHYPVAFLRMQEKTLHLEALAAFLEVPVESLKERLVPWHVARRAEMEAEDELLNENASTVTEERVLERARQLVEKYSNETGDVQKEHPHEYNYLHEYGDISQEIKDQLKAKFRSLQAKYDALPGFHVYEPADCKTRSLHVAH